MLASYKEKLQPVYNGVDSSVFYPGNTEAIRQTLGLSVSTRYLLFVGNYYPVKNPFLLLQAVAKLRQTVSTRIEIRVLMVGESPLKDKVESSLRKLGLTDVVTLPWKAKFCRSLSLCAQSISLYSVITKACPMCFEAIFLADCRIISTDVGGISESEKALPSVSLFRFEMHNLAQAIIQRLSVPADKRLILRYIESFLGSELKECIRAILNSAISSLQGCFDV